MSEIILFRSQDGKSEVQLRVEGDTVWLSQAEIAGLFDNKPQAITMLIKAIYEEGELTPEATCKESLQVRQEGSRQVNRTIKLCSLPMILAIGYRVRFSRGTEKTFAASRLRVSPIILCAGKRRSRAKPRRREARISMAFSFSSSFHENRKKAEALEADAEDVKELEDVEKRLRKGGDER